MYIHIIVVILSIKSKFQSTFHNVDMKGWFLYYKLVFEMELLW